MGKKIVFNKEQELDICQKYNSGFSTVQICKNYNCSSNVISKLLYSYGIKVSNKLFNEKQELDICSKYQQGQNIFQLGKIYSCDSTTITRILKRNSIKRRTASEIHRKYELDEGFFDVMNRTVAYVLGWYYSDGCNHNNSNVISLELKTEDRLILEIIAKNWKTNIPLSEYHEEIMKDKKGNIIYRKTDGLPIISKPTTRLSITSQKMSDALTRLGCIPTKTHILKFPSSDQVPDEYIPDFIRSYFEGDGYIKVVVNHKGNCDVQINVAGTEEFLNGMRTYLLNRGLGFIYVHPHNKKKENSIWILSISNILDVLLFKKFIYDDYFKENPEGDLYLQRKYNKFVELKKYVDNNIEKIRQLYRLRLLHKPENVDKVIDLYVNKKLTLKKIASLFKVDRTVIGDILKNKNIHIRTNSEAQLLHNKRNKV